MQTRWVIFFGVWLFVALVWVGHNAQAQLAPEPIHPPEWLLEAGIQHYEAGQWAEAQQYFAQLVAQYPQLSLAHNYLGYICLLQHQPTQAQAHFRNELALSPHTETPYEGLAQAQLAAGEYTQALNTVEQAQAHGIESAQLWHCQAQVAQHLGLHDWALQNLSMAANAEPENAERWAHLADALFENSDFRLADQYFQRAAGQGMHRARWWVQWALSKKYLYGPESALQTFERLMWMYPTNADILALKGKNEFDAQHFDQAYSSFDRLRQLQPNKPIYAANLAFCAQGMGKWHLAISHFTQAIRQGQLPLAELFRARSESYMHIGALRTALHDAQRAIELQPDEADHYLHRARLWANLGKASAAKADRETAQRLGATAQIELRPSANADF